jgi:tetratricopeptide (TPR) repeat protein
VNNSTFFGEDHLKSLRVAFLLVCLLALMAFGATWGLQWRTAPPPRMSSPDELFQQGLHGIRARDAQEIRTALAGLEPNSNQPDRVQLLQGALSLLTEDPQLALQDFARLDPQGPLRDPLLTLTGEALYRNGKLDEAQHCLLLALQDNPDNVEALRWLATVDYDLGDIDQTLQLLREVSRVAPEDDRPHHMQGAIYRDFGEHQKAITAFQRALELGASNPHEIRPLLASSQMSIKQFDAALVTLQECPETTNTLSLKADCLWQSGQSSAARETLAQAESLGKLPVSGKRLKARILIEQNELSAARQLLESLIASDSGDDEAEFQLALVFRQLKEESAYQAHFARSESIKALKTQLTAMSEQAMKEPSNAEIRDRLAANCEQLGLLPMAQVWRTAAASCRRRLPPPAPMEGTTP